MGFRDPYGILQIMAAQRPEKIENEARAFVLWVFYRRLTLKITQDLKTKYTFVASKLKGLRFMTSPYPARLILRMPS